MYSAVNYTGNGVQTDFAVPFPYLLKAHVEVTVGVAAGVYTWLNASTIRFTAAPANGSAIHVRRNSNRAARIVDFTDSANLTEEVLDTDSNQLMYLVQEAFDQAATANYFTSDAAGSRVTNMADPVLNTDGATKGWVQAYVTSITTGGTNILPLNNTWTGTNLFNNTVSVKGAVFDGTDVALKNVVGLNKGIHVNTVTNLATEIGYGLQVEVHRSSGYGLIVGAQIDAINEGYNVAGGWTFGQAVEAVILKAASANLVGVESTCANFNSNDSVNARVGLDVVFKNRGDLYATSGSSTFGVGDGTGGNFYNANACAIQISSQARAEAGATYVGWNRAFRILDQSIDVAKAAAYDGARQYKPGDQVASGGRVYVNTEASSGIAPALGGSLYWADMGVGSERKGIILDLSTYGATQASRLIAAIKLRGDGPMVWDTEEHISTRFDTTAGRWALKNDTAERFGIEASTGDIWINGVRRYLGNRSSFSAHRNGAFAVYGTAGVWQPIVCNYVERDGRGEYNTSSGIFTPNSPGDYQVTAQVHTENNAPGGARLFAAIVVNGAVYKTGNCITVAGTNNTARVNATVRCNGTTDNIAMYIYADAPLSLYGDPTVTYFQGTKVQ